MNTEEEKSPVGLGVDNSVAIEQLDRMSQQERERERGRDGRGSVLGEKMFFKVQQMSRHEEQSTN